MYDPASWITVEVNRFGWAGIVHVVRVASALPSAARLVSSSTRLAAGSGLVGSTGRGSSGTAARTALPGLPSGGTCTAAKATASARPLLCPTRIASTGTGLPRPCATRCRGSPGASGVGACCPGTRPGLCSPRPCACGPCATLPALRIVAACLRAALTRACATAPALASRGAPLAGRRVGDTLSGLEDGALPTFGGHHALSVHQGCARAALGPCFCLACGFAVPSACLERHGPPQDEGEQARRGNNPGGRMRDGHPWRVKAPGPP